MEQVSDNDDDHSNDSDDCSDKVYHGNVRQVVKQRQDRAAGAHRMGSTQKGLSRGPNGQTGLPMSPKKKHLKVKG